MRFLLTLIQSILKMFEILCLLIDPQNYQLTMWEYILAFSAVIFAYLVFVLFIKPLKKKSYYSKFLKNRGYKVYQYPYQFLTAPFYVDFQECQKQKGDFFYTARQVYSQGYDVILSNILNQPQVVFLNPELIKELHRTDIIQKLSKKSSAYQIFDYILHKGVLFVEKNVWKHRRKLLSNVFNYDFVTSQIPFMVKILDQSFDKMQREYWQKNQSKKSSNQIFTSLYDRLCEFTSTIVIGSFLGINSISLQLNGKPIHEQIMRLSDMSNITSRDPLIILFGQKALQMGVKQSFKDVKTLNNQINAALQKYIDKYRQDYRNQSKSKSNQIKGIIQLIVEDIDKGTNKEATSIKDEDLIDQIKTFMIAGTDTTSNYATMALLSLYQNKQALEKLRKEINQHIKTDADITHQNIKKITFFEKVLLECSRTYPAASSIFERQIMEDVEIDGIAYTTGMSFCTLNIPFNNSPKIFENPKEFRPERWEADTEQNKKLAQGISYQFSGGARSCIGKHLAMAQTKVIIIKFLKRYQNMVQPGRNNRQIVNILVEHLANSDVVLTKFP